MASRNNLEIIRRSVFSLLMVLGTAVEERSVPNEAYLVLKSAPHYTLLWRLWPMSCQTKCGHRVHWLELAPPKNVAPDLRIVIVSDLGSWVASQVVVASPLEGLRRRHRLGQPAQTAGLDTRRPGVPAHG